MRERRALGLRGPKAEGCGSFAATEIRSVFAELVEGSIRIDRERVAYWT